MAVKQEQHGDPLAWLGQVAPPPQNGHASAVRTGFSNIEKIMLASVLISAASFIWQINRSS